MSTTTINTTPSASPATKETDTCNVCEYANKHAWWGPDLAPARSHCRDCHRSWASLTEGHCAMCCGHFANEKSFDAHLLEESGCVDPGTLLRRDGRPRFILRERPFGKVWSVADYRDPSRRPFSTTSEKG
jgi:hypothetical protein